MRNLTDEQVQEIAYDIVRDHLMGGVEYIDLVETVNEFMDDGGLGEDGGEEATDDDYKTVSSVVENLLDKLQTVLAEDL
jgi:hypothetical protein